MLYIKYEFIDIRNSFDLDHTILTRTYFLYSMPGTV